MADRDRDKWVQTNAEFQRDWAAHDQSEHVNWRSGLTFGPQKSTGPSRKYAAEGARRRPRTWLLWIMIALVAGAIAIVVLDSTGVVDIATLVRKAAKAATTGTAPSKHGTRPGPS